MKKAKSPSLDSCKEYIFLPFFSCSLESLGKLILNNARVLPEELVGNKPVIMGFNDLKNGQLFIDFDNLMVYIDQ